jgi:hypothetical protein
MTSEMATTLASSVTGMVNTMCITSWITVFSWQCWQLSTRPRRWHPQK